MTLAWIFTNIGGPDAGALDLAAKPTLSMYYECTAGEYFYNVIMKNPGGTVSTKFTVITQIGSKPQKVDVYPIAPDAELSIAVLMPEGVLSTIHVINPDGDVIDDLRTPTPDCVAAVDSYVTLRCDDDGSAAVVFEWVNNSYTSAHVTLQVNELVMDQGDYGWPNNTKTVEFPVTEGTVFTASILVDGIASSTINEIVDCVVESTPTTTVPVPPSTTSTVPETTSTTSTVPPTTTSSTTVKPTSTTSTTSTSPSTTIQTTTSTVPPANISTTVAPAVVEGVAVVRQAQQPTSRLAVTGGSTGWMAALAMVLIMVGAAMWVGTRRLRSGF